jgi:hypothetical protein
VKIQVFLDVMLCHKARSSQSFEGTTIFQNVGDCSPSETTSHPSVLECNAVSYQTKLESAATSDQAGMFLCLITRKVLSILDE